MFKLDLNKEEEPAIKLPTSVESQKKQESSRKTSIYSEILKLNVNFHIDSDARWQDNYLCVSDQTFLDFIPMKLKPPSGKPKSWVQNICSFEKQLDNTVYSLFFLLRNLSLIKFQTSLKNLFIILLKKIVEGRRTGPCFRLSHSGIQTPTLKAKHLFLRERLNDSDRD